MADDLKHSATQKNLVDTQSEVVDRKIALDRVGVRGLRTPIVVLDRDSVHQNTVANISLSVNLPHHFKGTHMSRFVEVLERHRGEMTMRTLPRLCEDLRTRLDADAAHVTATFPYFLEKPAPVSGAKALMDVECAFIGEVDADHETFTLRVAVPVTSLCPCSKAISDYGAHNQRGIVTLEVRTRPVTASSPTSDAVEGAFEMIWIEELVAIAEASASAPVYPLLKRADERHVTMQAFDNPVFVEDMVRNAARALMDDERVVWLKVMAENEESIHNHAAFAELEWARG